MTAKTKNIIVFLLLLFFYPIGILMMLIWRQVWTWWVRLALFLPLILAVLMILSAGFMLFIGGLFGVKSLNQNVKQAQTVKERVDCENICYVKAESEILKCKKLCLK